MPYVKRKFPMRRKRSTKRAYRKYSATTAKRAATALRMVKRVRSMVRPEFKWRDNILAPTTIPNTVSASAIVNFTNIPAGTGPFDRTGNRVLLKSWMPRIEITGGESCRVRLMVLQDTRRNYNTTTLSMAAISATDILANTTYPMISPYNIAVAGKFRVLKDVTLNYDHDDYGKKTIKWYFRFNNVLKFGDATQTEPNVNGIYLVHICDASTPPSITCFSRLRWIDS